jgi:DNA-binding NarL/FixJ family response regulator
MIRVLLVDDHRVVLAGLAGLIDAAEDMQVVGLAPDGEAAASMASRTAPDVVVMDLSMPRMDGIAATGEVLRACPDCQVLVLTSFSDRQRIVDALRAGAVGYMLKDSEPEELLRAIRAAARGDSPLDPRVAREVLRSGAAVVSRPDLTDREQAVLRLVAHGLANKQIASRLGIREGTVKTHLSNAFQRIGVADRTSAALWVRANLPEE